MARTILAVFDLDGTIIDSRRDLAESANEMLAGYHAGPLDEQSIASMVGSGAATLVKLVIAAGGIDAPLEEALARFLSLYDLRLTHHTRPYQGIARLLGELRDRQISIALLTNKPLHQSVKILEAFELTKYFRWIVGGDGPWPRKPFPDGIRFLMRQASAGPSETILIGDSAVDLQTSRNAGVRFCLTRYGFGYVDLAPTDLTGDEALADTPAEIAWVLRARR